MKRLRFRMDADQDVEWITVSGQHVPLVNGEAVGGHFKGQKFLSARSVKSGGSSSRRSSKGSSGTVPALSATHQKFKDRAAGYLEKRKKAEDDIKKAEREIFSIKHELFSYKRVSDEGLTYYSDLDEARKMLALEEKSVRNARSFRKKMDNPPKSGTAAYSKYRGELKLRGIASKSREEQIKKVDGEIDTHLREVKLLKNVVGAIEDHAATGTWDKRDGLINGCNERLQKESDKIDKCKGDIERFKAERKDLINKTLSSWDKCKDSEDIKLRVLNSDLYKVEETVKDMMYGMDLPDRDSWTAIDKCDFKVAKEAMGYVDKVFDRYPKLKGVFKPIDCYRGDPDREYASKMDKALAATAVGSGKVKLNLAFWEDPKRWEAMEEKMKKGSHRAVYGKESAVFHEYGHAIDGLLSKGLWKEGKLGLGGTFSGDVLEKCMKRFKKGESEIEKELCHYAVGDPQEFLAEAFAEYTCSPSPRRIAAYVGPMIENEMKRQGYL